MLIDICLAFDIDNDIVYNKEKTKCMCIKPSLTKYLYVPQFYLGHLKIKVVEVVCLGNIIDTDMVASWICCSEASSPINRRS